MSLSKKFAASALALLVTLSCGRVTRSLDDLHGDGGASAGDADDAGATGIGPSEERVLQCGDATCSVAAGAGCCYDPKGIANGRVIGRCFTSPDDCSYPGTPIQCGGDADCNEGQVCCLFSSYYSQSIGCAPAEACVGHDPAVGNGALYHPSGAVHVCDTDSPPQPSCPTCTRDNGLPARVGTCH